MRNLGEISGEEGAPTSSSSCSPSGTAIGDKSTVPSSLPSPVTDPAPVAHGPLAVAAVDMESGGGLVEAVDGSACAQLDHLVGDVPELEALQQVNVGCIPVFLGTATDS